MRNKRERASSPSFVHDQSSGKGRLEAAPGRRATTDGENRFNAVPERRIADKTRVCATFNYATRASGLPQKCALLKQKWAQDYPRTLSTSDVKESR